MPIMDDYKQGLSSSASTANTFGATPANTFGTAPANTLEAKAAATNGCISFLSVLQICWEIKSDEIIITLKLLGHTIGTATLNPSHPTVTLGGSILGFTAEVTLTLDFSSLSLKICGKVCAPFAGCKQGCTTIHI